AAFAIVALVALVAELREDRMATGAAFAIVAVVGVRRGGRGAVVAFATVALVAGDAVTAWWPASPSRLSPWSACCAVAASVHRPRPRDAYPSPVCRPLSASTAT